jgi:hypothetical protein
MEQKIFLIFKTGAGAHPAPHKIGIGNFPDGQAEAA